MQNKFTGVKMKELFTTFEIAKMCSVDITTVINWVNSKKLKGYKTPGGHRRIQLADFLDFLKKYNLPIPKGIESRETVLIVDDDEQIRFFIRETLKRKWPQMQIWEAEDGFKAGKLLVEQQPALVILDIKLPGIDGIGVCQLIRNDEVLKKTKILAITGYFSPAAKQNIIKAGADNFIVKPFTGEKLVTAVGKLL
jgi:excisionase family DNA binding protein